MFPDIEKPSSANAVIEVLTAVTMPGPKRLINRALIKLETIVPVEIIIVTKFA